MSLKLDDLDTFKQHRNEISESLTNKLIGRKKEIDNICDLLNQNNFVALTGPAGIGKSRLAVAAIEKYSSVNKDVIVLCIKSFGDYISAIDESIDCSKKYLLFIDDASNLKRISEVIECLKYHRNNMKAIFTIRDYLKDCVDDDAIKLYEVSSLSEEDIIDTLSENTAIKNKECLKKISNISKGNIRLAFILSDAVLKNEKGFESLFNVKDVLNSFYKDQINKMSNSNNLIIVAGIVSFFKSINLNQLFYISLILKIFGITKSEFLRCVDLLITMELVDECIGIVKISDQCFADYLLNYVFIEKKYIKIKDLIVNTYKYYKKKIIESINAILATCLNDESISYIKGEVLEACMLIENVELKHEVEAIFAPLIPNQAVIEFKKGVEEYLDKKDIKWLLNLFTTLAKTQYQLVAIDGIMMLLKKTKSKKEEVFKIINETFILDYDCIKTSFVYLNNFVEYLIKHNINDEHFYSIVSSYLKYSFRNTRFSSNYKLESSSFNVNNYMPGIILFRRNCWNYIFSYGIEKSLKVIFDFAMYHFSKDADEIVKYDLIVINENLENQEYKELIQAVLYEEFSDDAKNFGFQDLLFTNKKYKDILHVILERNKDGQDYDVFKKKYDDNARKFYIRNKLNVFKMINEIDIISNYYHQNIVKLLTVILSFLEEFNESILKVYVRYKVYPNQVIAKAFSIIGLDSLYNEIQSIKDASMKEEYLYAFYSFIDYKNIKELFEFEKWIKSKKHFETQPIYSRNVLSIRTIAEKSNIPYLKLIKIIFNKKVSNEIIVKEYFSYLFYKEGAFKELLDLDRDLAIKIYEFLIIQKVNDYDNKALREIINRKRNYIKVFAKRYIENGMSDESGLKEILFNNDNYKLFFNTCFEIGKEKLPYFFSFPLQQLFKDNIKNQNVMNWILDYIDRNYKDDKSMEALFSILASINTEDRNHFIIKYYEKGKDEEVLKYALLNQSEPYSLNSAESYFERKISSLESLKTQLIKWNSLNLISFINDLIENYKKNIRENKISQLIEYVDVDLLNELKEIDLKTEISLIDAFKLYVNDNNFHKILSADCISYKDGSFVTNNNIPLKFADIIKDRKIIGIKVIQTVDDIDTRYEQYLSSMKDISKRFKDGNQTTLIEYLYQLFLEKNWTVNEFMQETALTRDLFSKIKNKQKKNLTKKTLVQILIGLKLPKSQRDYLLEKNGTQLSTYNEEDVLYDFILASGIEIDDADALFKDLGKEGFIKKY